MTDQTGELAGRLPRIAQAINACDWSGPSIGNKVILQEAVARLIEAAAALRALRAERAEFLTELGDVEIDGWKSAAHKLKAVLDAVEDNERAREATIATQAKEIAALWEASVSVMAALAAAISLLERTPTAKRGAPSDRMFDQMLSDYRKALNAARDLAKRTEQP